MLHRGPRTREACFALTGRNMAPATIMVRFASLYTPYALKIAQMPTFFLHNCSVCGYRLLPAQQDENCPECGCTPCQRQLKAGNMSRRWQGIDGAVLAIMLYAFVSTVTIAMAAMVPFGPGTMIFTSAHPVLSIVYIFVSGVILYFIYRPRWYLLVGYAMSIAVAIAIGLYAIEVVLW